MMGMLKSLGIEKGKPFAPDAITKKAMRQGAIDAWYYVQHWYDNPPKRFFFWPNRHYASLLQSDANKRFSFTYDDSIDITARAAQYVCVPMCRKY